MDATNFQGNRDALRARLGQLRDALAGRVPAALASAQRAWEAVGIEALAITREAFLDKSRNGQDAAGVRWAPLSPRTIAYGRRHPGLKAKRTRAAKAGREKRPLLTSSHDSLWRGIYASALKRGKTPQEAAMLAWAIVKSRGGKTILGQYGGTQVETLRDTGRLFASLGPGAPGNKLDAGGGVVTVGTNVVYAQSHQKGTSRIPARPIFHEGPWPQVWQDRLAGILAEAVKAVIADLLRS